MSKVIVWFSCGAASAVAARYTIEKYGSRAELVYCDTSSTEHPDNSRFMSDVEKWLDRRVKIIKSSTYSDVDDVFERTRYMAGIKGARCTTEMKKMPRFEYQEADDIHVFGMTSDEKKRAERLQQNNPELILDWVLLDNEVTKQDCYDIIRGAGIELPIMYQLGFKNNNCIGCVKATSIEYWKKVRKHFPEVFEKRVRQSRELGVRLTRLKGERIFIDEIPYDEGEDPVVTEDVSCGPDCKGFNDG